MRNTRQIDHYIGRHVESVEGSPGEWRINLVGDVAIINCDRNNDFPAVPAGWVFMSTDRDNSSLVFGIQDYAGNVIQSQKVQLNFNEYQLFEPGFSEEPFTPSEAVAFDPETPPHPDERIAEGPLEPVSEPDTAAAPEAVEEPAPTKKAKKKGKAKGASN